MPAMTVTRVVRALRYVRVINACYLLSRHEGAALRKVSHGVARAATALGEVHGALSGVHAAAVLGEAPHVVRVGRTALLPGEVHGHVEVGKFGGGGEAHGGRRRANATVRALWAWSGK